MGLSKEQRSEIAELLTRTIRHKLSGYSPETNNMPFHTRLLGRERMAPFTFIHSVSTTLGMSVFEQVTAIIANPRFKQAVNQYKGFSNRISDQAQNVIQEIIDNLKTGKKNPNKIAETEALLAVCRSGSIKLVKQPRIDFFLETHGGVEYYFDLKTAKPNKGEIAGFKRSLLEWVALRGAENPNVDIRTLLAIPYNPYEPEPYERWTFDGMLDLPNELMVADEFWDFIGGENAYTHLLDVFEEVGAALSPEIDAKFENL